MSIGDFFPGWKALAGETPQRGPKPAKSTVSMLWDGFSEEKEKNAMARLEAIIKHGHPEVASWVVAFGKPFRYIFDNKTLLPSCSWLVLEYLAGSTPRLDQIAVAIVPLKKEKTDATESEETLKTNNGEDGAVARNPEEKKHPNGEGLGKCSVEDVAELITGLDFRIQDLINFEELPQRAKEKFQENPHMTIVRFTNARPQRK